MTTNDKQRLQLMTDLMLPSTCILIHYLVSLSLILIGLKPLQNIMSTQTQQFDCIQFILALMQNPISKYDNQLATIELDNQPYVTNISVAQEALRDYM